MLRILKFNRIIIIITGIIITGIIIITKLLLLNYYYKPVDSDMLERLLRDTSV